MDEKEVSLREKLNFNENSFCKELNSEKKYLVISLVQLDCKEYYIITINKLWEFRHTGDPYVKYFDYDLTGQ